MNMYLRKSGARLAEPTAVEPSDLRRRPVRLLCAPEAEPSGSGRRSAAFERRVSLEKCCGRHQNMEWNPSSHRGFRVFLDFFIFFIFLFNF
jgi:hypothetical protein